MPSELLDGDDGAHGDAVKPSPEPAEALAAGMGRLEQAQGFAGRPYRLRALHRLRQRAAEPVDSAQVLPGRERQGIRQSAEGPRDPCGALSARRILQSVSASRLTAGEPRAPLGASSRRRTRASNL